MKDDADDGDLSDVEPFKEPEDYAYRADKLEEYGIVDGPIFEATAKNVGGSCHVDVP